MEIEATAKVLYEAYCEDVGWKSFKNEPLPQWSEVSPKIKHAWCASASKVIDYLLE